MCSAKCKDLMMATELNSRQLTLIVSNLAKLHEWEVQHSPMLSTLTGRHLYYRIVQRAVGDQALLSKSMKDLMGGVGYTDKALRLRVREMEKEGYVASVNGEDDARCRYLMPTERFYEFVYFHANEVKRIFEKDFLMLEK
jgi:DNA-binding MarR family transcriptional regulator